METEKELTNDSFDKIYLYIFELVGPYVHLLSVRSLLLWERPYLSAVALVFGSLLYWAAVLTSISVYSFVALVIIGVFLFRTLISHCPSISASVSPNEEILKWFKAEPELSQYASEWWSSVYRWGKRVWGLRQKEPSQFCKLGCYAFTFLLLMGQMFPTTIVMYSFVVTAFTSPLINFYLRPAEFLQQLVASIDAETQELQAEALYRGTSNAPEDVGNEEVDEKLHSEGAKLLEKEDKGGGTANTTEIENLQTEVKDSIYSKAVANNMSDNEEEMLQLPCTDGGTSETALPDADDLLYDKPKGSQQSHKSEDYIHFVPTHFKEESQDVEDQDLQQMMYFSTQDSELNISADNDEGFRKFQAMPSHDEQCENTSTSDHQDKKSSPVMVSTSPPTPSRKSSQCSEIDISEYDIVSETELES